MGPGSALQIESVRLCGVTDQSFDRERAQGAAARIRARRRGVTLGRLAIKDLINEGRP